MNININKPQTGILLINLGTPDQPTVKSIRKYLAEFLMDKRVVSLPWFFRFILVYGLICPFRPQKTQKNYQKIWLNNGSPLKIYSEELVNNLQKKLGENYKVALGMRYGNPSIQNALDKLIHCDHIKIIPLFPQYASASSGSAIEAVLKKIAAQYTIPNLQIINHFYQHPAYINNISQKIKTTSKYFNLKDSHILFSYHGIPVKQLDCPKPCELKSKCNIKPNQSSNCYRAQCYQTSDLIAKKLNLKPDQYSTAFQSRLGKTPWIGPFTDQYLKNLKDNKNIENLILICPGFIADCLETLEEINMELRSLWNNLGGKNFEYIPALNGEAGWLEELILTQR